ncbi:hypothetical protein [Massilia genomosp. 1]|uniref:hypothetical protein n=1 Tax=Massilia genomosp. 1 TaxID=2609280 RepID=UPI001E2C1FD6|nr:hypothetical protein [Massilia genomosp. 1]
MSQAIPHSPDLDLSSCDQEPIRFPGSIQPHGFLLALSPTLQVLQASDNLDQMIGVDCERAIGQALEAVIGEQAACSLGPRSTPPTSASARSTCVPSASGRCATSTCWRITTMRC